MPRKQKNRTNVPPLPQTQKKTPTPQKTSKPITSARGKKDPMAAFFNIAQNPKLSPMFPTGASSRARRTRVEVEDEYIADISGSVSFSTTAFAVNPGQSRVFPWLSKEALLFEKYKILRLEFYYRPQVSAYATNGQTGKVMLSFDFDASDAPPASKQQVEDTHPHSDGMPFEEVILTIDPKDCSLQDSYYVRPGGLPGSSDIKTFDVGILSVSTVGNNSTANIGELRVRYAIALHDPVLENTVSAPLNYHLSQFQSASSESYGASGSTTTLLLTTSVSNGLGLTNSSGTFILPTGNYLVFGDDLAATGSGMTGHYLYLLVNGSAIANVSANSSSYAWQESSQNVTQFITSTGSTTLALAASLAYASGTCTNFGTLTILAV